MSGFSWLVAAATRTYEEDERVHRFGPTPVAGWRAVVKRLLDLLICTVLLLLALLPMAVIALAIRLESAGPVIYSQVRVGQYGRRFTIFKFRTMYTEAEYSGACADSRPPVDEPRKQRFDRRVTPLGRRLRRTSLDELPQLFNVLAGTMTVVGPRPELPKIVAAYEDWQYERLLVPQGITGWWQVNGRSDRAMHLHTEDDIFYVRHFSLWLDIKVLLKTVPAVLAGTGAF